MRRTHCLGCWSWSSHSPWSSWFRRSNTQNGLRLRCSIPRNGCKSFRAPNPAETPLLTLNQVDLFSTPAPCLWYRSFKPVSTLRFSTPTLLSRLSSPSPSQLSRLSVGSSFQLSGHNVRYHRLHSAHRCTWRTAEEVSRWVWRLSKMRWLGPSRSYTLLQSCWAWSKCGIWRGLAERTRMAFMNSKNTCRARMNLVYNLSCIYHHLLDLDIPIDFSRTVALTRIVKSVYCPLSTVHPVQSDSSTPRDPTRLDAPHPASFGTTLCTLRTLQLFCWSCSSGSRALWDKTRWPESQKGYWCTIHTLVADYAQPAAITASSVLRLVGSRTRRSLQASWEMSSLTASRRRRADQRWWHTLWQKLAAGRERYQSFLQASFVAASYALDKILTNLISQFGFPLTW